MTKRNRDERAPQLASLALVGALLTSACLGEITDPGASSSSDPPGAPGGVQVNQAALGEPRVRLLSASEYRQTISDLLGLEASDELAHADLGAGYDTGAAGQLDQNVFTALVDEAERLAALYVEQRLAQDYDCFDPAQIVDSCISNIIDGLGKRAFRRPLTAEQSSELMAFYKSVVTETDELKATETLIARLISSTHFLYRTELGVREGKRSTLDAFERASLISYALTGSMPDADLFADAEAGQLDDDRIRGHVRRLLATPSGKARLTDFFKQWLRVQELDTMATTPEAYPKLSGAAQGAALKGEFEAYVSDVVFDGAGSLPALLTGGYTFVNQHTASLYDQSLSGDQLVRIDLDTQKRKGILSLASVMAVHSSVGDEAKDRPVVRGLLIKNQLLCEEVGLPSGINTTEAAMAVTDDMPNFDELTTREQFEAMMNQSKECQDCHQQFMPYGFLLGSYDALGRFTTKKGDRPIETNVAGLALDGALDSYADFVAFVDELADSQVAPRCFTKNFVAYTVGTTQGDHVDELSSALAESFDAQGQDVQRLIEEVFVKPELYVKVWE